MKPKAWLVILGAAVMAAALAFWLPSGQKDLAGISAGTLVLLSAFMALNGSPAGIAFVERHVGAIKAMGWALVVLGVAVVVAVPFTPYPADRFGWIIYLGVGLSLTGFMTVRLPRMLKEAGAVRAEVERQAEPEIRAEARRFHGLSEGLDAATSVVRNPGAVLQIVGPWVVLLVTFGLIVLAATQGEPGPSGSPLTAVVLWMLPLFVLLVIGTPTVVVAWARWSMRGERPRRWVALPDRAALSVAWRLWIFFSALGSADGLASLQASSLAAKLGVSPEITAALVAACVDLLLIGLATSWGLRLIALALGDRSFDQGVAMVRTRPLWPGLPLGMIVAILPFTVVGITLDLLEQRLNYGPFAPLTGLFLLGSALTGFGAVIAATTYAGQVYRALREPDPPANPEVIA